MSHRSNSKNRLDALRGGVALLLAALLAGCGSPSDSSTSPPQESGARGPGSSDFLPPRPVRVVAKTDPAVEECIEKNIHGKEFDSLSPRDARRKLRRLQVKDDCEERLAGR